MEAFYNMQTPAAFVLVAIVAGLAVIAIVRIATKSGLADKKLQMELESQRYIQTQNSKKPPQIEVDH